MIATDGLLEFDVTLLERDYVRGSRLMVFDALKLSVPVFFLCGFVLYLIWNFAIYGIALATPYNMLVLLKGGLIALGFVLSGVILYYLFGVPRIARREFARMPFAGAPTHYRFDATGLHTHNDFGTEDLPYSMLGRTRVNRDLVMLGKGSTAAFTIPRDQLSKEDESALFDLLRERDLWKRPVP